MRPVSSQLRRYLMSGPTLMSGTQPEKDTARQFDFVRLAGRGVFKNKAGSDLDEWAVALR